MMAKRFWVRIPRWNKSLVTAALESGADAIMVPRGKSADTKALGIITTISPDGDLKLGEDLFEVTIRSKKDEEKALSYPADRFLIVRTADWKVIPLENLIAARGRIIAEVSSVEEARLALEIMEKGAPYKNPLDKNRLISAMRKAGLPEHPPLELPEKPFIAVLPLRNLSGDPNQDFLSDGFTEDIITFNLTAHNHNQK